MFQLSIKVLNKSINGLLRVNSSTSSSLEWRRDFHAYLHPERDEPIPDLSYEGSSFSLYDEESMPL